MVCLAATPLVIAGEMEMSLQQSNRIIWLTLISLLFSFGSADINAS